MSQTFPTKHKPTPYLNGLFHCSYSLRHNIFFNPMDTFHKMGMLIRTSRCHVLMLITIVTEESFEAIIIERLSLNKLCKGQKVVCHLSARVQVKWWCRKGNILRLSGAPLENNWHVDATHRVRDKCCPPFVTLKSRFCLL